MLNCLSDERFFHYQGADLFCEQVALSDLAHRFQTPLYVYSKGQLLHDFERYQQALGKLNHLVCYAVKANGNLALLQQLARAGAGFDIVSIGELARVKAAGGDTKKVIFSGVGKTRVEILKALQADILCFNVESIPELDRIAEVAREHHLIARISIRVNPNVDAKTHPYISTGLRNNKFGVAYEECFDLYRRAASLPNIAIVGIDCHIGSQITQIEPYLDSFEKILDLVEKLREIGISLHHIDMGGGIGVCYQKSDQLIDLNDLVEQIFNRLKERNLTDLNLIVEPGRSVVCQSGALLMQAQYVKKTPTKKFLIVDASMTEMLRPALYQANMPLCEVHRNGLDKQTYEVVGPVCESSDWLAHDCPLDVLPDQYLAMLMAGAYGSSMSSTYNARPRPAEVLVDGKNVHLIRQRDSYESLWENEKML